MNDEQIRICKEASHSAGEEFTMFTTVHYWILSYASPHPHTQFLNPF